jgi:hypothetical protein
MRVRVMKEGYIYWDGKLGRPDIKYNDGTYYGGLHCGNTLDVLLRGEWRPARIECRYDDTWYLAGIDKSCDIFCLTVRN